MRVLGIDPGLRNMGWGIVDVSGNKLSHIANGVCQSQGNDQQPDCYPYLIRWRKY